MAGGMGNGQSLGGRVPLLGSGPTEEDRRRAMAAAVQQGVSQLSLKIYRGLALSFLERGDESFVLLEGDCERLRELARGSRRAALCFFEGLGMLNPEVGSDG